MRVLVAVERELADVVRGLLEREGHTPTLIHSIKQAIQVASALGFDAIVVDTTPSFNGYALARLLRDANVTAPMLMLIAKEAVGHAEKVRAAGADDFLVKPFIPGELNARLQTLELRGPPPPVRLSAGDLEMDLGTRRAWRASVEIRLTRKEFHLLRLLMMNPGTVQHRDELLEALGDAKGPVKSNTLDAFIRLLRRKVDRNHAVKLIQTIRGVGYCLSVEKK